MHMNGFVEPGFLQQGSRGCQRSSIRTYDELEMDSPAFRNGTMDGCFQSSPPVKSFACVKSED